MPARPLKFHQTQQWDEHQERVEAHRLRIQAELNEAIEHERLEIQLTRKALKMKSPPLLFKGYTRKSPAKPRRTRAQWRDSCLVRLIDHINRMASNPGWSIAGSPQ